MNRQWSLNLGMLVLVSILLIVALLQPGIEKKSFPSLTDIDTQKITSIVISRPATDQIVLNKENDHWRLQKPLSARASAHVVSNVIALATAPSFKQLPYNEKTDTDKYGFDNPRAQIDFDQQRLVFGDTNPLNQHQYVLFNSQVHMISSNALWSVARGYNNYLDRRLLGNGAAPVAIEFDRQLKLVLRDGQWSLTPKNPSLTSDQLMRIANEWRYASALKIEPGRPMKTKGNVRVVFPDNKIIDLGIVSMSPELVLVRRDENLQYHFAAGTEKRLFPPAK